MSFRLTAPKIVWNGHTLTFGYPLDNVKCGDSPREGSEQLQSPAGSEDAWTVGTDYLLEADVRWIPGTVSSAPVATGWDDATTGVRLFLQWARDKNAFTFYPDQNSGTNIANCYLVDPMTGTPDPEADGSRQLKLKIRNASTPFDGY